MCSYNNTYPELAWVDSENYSSNLYLVTLDKGVGCGRKNEEQMSAYWTPKRS